MAGTDDNLGVGGGTPPPQVGPSLADEEAAMQSGKGRMLAGIIAVCVAVAVGAVFLLMEGETHEEYRLLGKSVNGPDVKGNFDKFWGCALQNVNLRDLKKAEELIAQVDMRGSSAMRLDYGKHVRDKCMEKLTTMQSKLDIVTAPAELQSDISGMKDASGQLRSAWSSYLGYITDKKVKYDEYAARPKIKEIARGWYEFKKAHAALNKKLKEKLQ
jgi:hypothetical protein